MNIEFQQVVEDYAPGMYRLAYSYCSNRSDAEDVVQEVLIKYLQQPPRCDGPERLRAWLMTATANKCKDLLRSRRRRNTQPLAEACAQTGMNDDALALHAALMQLPPGQRSAVYLFYSEDMPTRQIAQPLRISETAVRSRLFQARKALKTLLGGDANG